MLDLTKPISTRDGRAVRIVATDSTHAMGPDLYPLVADVEHPNEPGQWVRWHYMADGRWKSNDPENGNDLVNVRTHEDHLRWARGIDDARRAVVVETGVTDEKAIMVLCAAFNRMWEDAEEGQTEWCILDDDFGDILEASGAGARRVATWLRKGAAPHMWAATSKGAALFDLMAEVTRKAWEARP